MKRIASGSQAASAPASYGADVGSPGYFQDAATTPSGSPTQLTPKWANMVQEAIVQTIEGSGAALADTLSQFADTVVGVHATKSHSSDTGNVTTNKTRGVFAGSGKATGASSAVIGSTTTGSHCLASGAGSVCAASAGSTASGTLSAVVAAGLSTASGANSAVVGGASNTASAGNALVAGGTSGTASATYAIVAGGTGGTASASAAGTFAGDSIEATAAHAVAAGGINNAAGGEDSAVIGGSSSATTATALRSVIAGGTTVVVNVPDCFAAAATDSFIPDGQRCAVIAAKDVTTGDTGYNGRVILASRGIVLNSSKTTGGNQAYIVGGGYSTNMVSGLETANADVYWTIDSQTGTMRSQGSFTGSTDPNADVAEYHEHAETGELPVGALVANVGRLVRLAVPGDRVFGVVSATPLLVAGSADLGWAKQYVTDEWGRPVYEQVPMARFPLSTGRIYDGREDQAPEPVPEAAQRYTERDRVRNPAYDPTREYLPRTERPEEWSPIAKLGLVRVRVGAQVKVGDLLAPGKDGVAVATTTPKGRREVEVLELLSPFDKSRGFAIALCDVG